MVRLWSLRVYEVKWMVVEGMWRERRKEFLEEEGEGGGRRDRIEGDKWSVTAEEDFKEREEVEGM